MGNGNMGYDSSFLKEVNDPQSEVSPAVQSSPWSCVSYFNQCNEDFAEVHSPYACNALHSLPVGLGLSKAFWKDWMIQRKK